MVSNVESKISRIAQLQNRLILKGHQNRLILKGQIFTIHRITSRLDHSVSQ